MKTKRSNVKNAFAALTIFSLALAASLTYSLMSGHSTSAKSAHSPLTTYAAPAAASSAAAVAVQNGIVIPSTAIYALDTDNTIFVLWPGATSFVRLVRPADNSVDGNLIGIDFRPADGNNNSLYAVTDTGKIYTIRLTPTGLGTATLVSSMTPGFPSGYQSLMDFNPVVNALRLIGSDALNYAVVNNAGNLNQTAIQTALTYNTADVARGISPKISAGAYTNNFNGATATIFYAIDTQRDSLVTIDPPTPGASSATAGGVLRTIGNLVTSAGARINVGPTTDIDILTTSNGTNRLVGVSGRMFFTIDLNQVTPSTALGTAKNIVVQGIPMGDLGGRMLDVAAAPVFYEAENGIQGGGNTVNADQPGFTGTGFVNFADNVPGGATTLQVNQSGTQTLLFRYANGSAANRPCNITVNGTSVGTVTFPPTGAFTTYRTVSLSVNLGTAQGFRNVQIRATTATGGPNLDSVIVAIP